MVIESIQERPTDYSNQPDYDGLWKKIIKDLFREFMLFFAPDLYDDIDFNKAPNFLEQELFKEVIQRKKGKNIADQIVKVDLKNGRDKWVLIHVEVQNEHSSEFSKRMFRYFYRIYDKFDKEVYAIALMTDDKESKHKDFFHYHFHGTTVTYSYNIYKFHEHPIEILKQSSNPFAAAVIAGKYASKYKSDDAQRYHFKVQLMKQILQKFLKPQTESRTYVTSLFYFIDYILQTPNHYEEELRKEINNYLKKEGGKQMRAEEEILSPTLKGVLEMLEKEEIEKAEMRGRLEGKEKGIVEGRRDGELGARLDFAKKLLSRHFSNEEIVELTGLKLQEIIELKKQIDRDPF